MVCKKREMVVNQSVLIWSVIIIFETFVIAYLMNSSVLILAALLMFWPIKAAINWPKPVNLVANSNSGTKSARIAEQKGN